MKPTYQPFIDKMIHEYEGGYGWDKKDPGGPTNYGITCYDLAEHRGQKMNSTAAWAPVVRAMTLQEAEDIYVDKYADRIDFNHLNDGIDVAMMDYAVNSGWPRPIRVARAILNAPGPAAMTPGLVAMLNKTDPKVFINAMMDERLHFMHGIRNGEAWAEFGRGWRTRVENLRSYATALATKQAVPSPSPVVLPVQVKAMHDAPSMSGPTKVVAIPAAALASSGHYFAGLSPTLMAVGAGVAILGAVGYVMYRQAQADKANATVVLPNVA